MSMYIVFSAQSIEAIMTSPTKKISTSPHMDKNAKNKLFLKCAMIKSHAVFLPLYQVLIYTKLDMLHIIQ